MSQTTFRGSFDPDWPFNLVSQVQNTRTRPIDQPKQRAPGRSLVLVVSYGFEKRFCCDILHTIAGAGWTTEETRKLISVRDQADVQAHLDGVAQNPHVCEQILSLYVSNTAKRTSSRKTQQDQQPRSQKPFSYLDRSSVLDIPANFKNVV